MTMEEVVQLRRRVKNADTDMFEWRKCECSVSGDGKLVIALVGDQDGEEEDGGEEREETRVVIDLAWQLKSIEQKRKCRTRCEVQYISSLEDRTLCSEELMAPSSKHCEQWIELVTEAEKRAKRRQSIRQGTATATAVAIEQRMSMSTASSASSSVPPPSSLASSMPPQSTAASSSTSSEGFTAPPPPPAPPAMRVMSSSLLRVSQKTLARSRRSSRLSGSLGESGGSREGSESRGEPLSPQVFAQKLDAVRHSQPVDQDMSDEGEEHRHGEEQYEPTTKHRLLSQSSSSSINSTVYPRVRARASRSGSISSTTPFSPASSVRRISSSRGPQVRPAVRPSTGLTSAAAVAASLARLRRRDSPLGLDANSPHYPDANVGEELDILLRVESALRQLERENAAAKEKEVALTHQVQSLADALRVRTAEKKHLEAQLHQLARDKEQWKQAAQRAEQAMVQMQDELAIAQEETQLVATEQHRLKHHNKELLSQVHRLDSIVYGRF